MEQRINKLLFDIRSSIESIEGFVGENRNFSYYLSNNKQLPKLREQVVALMKK